MAREESLRAGENIKELTIRGIILGAVLTVILTVPASELAPYRVPCGPSSTSMRAMSYT